MSKEGHFRARAGRFALAAVVSAGLAVPAAAQDARSYILATATTGGTYYPVGVAIATLVKVRLEASENIAMSAISSAGSGENVRLMQDDEAQFSILQGLFGAWARGGAGMLEGMGPQENIRSIANIWQNVEHFLVRSEHVTNGTMDDLEGMRGAAFSIGARNSGTEGSGRTILAGLGIDVDEHFEVVYMGYTPSVEALQNNTIAGANLPGGPPVGAVTQAFANLGDGVKVLDFTDDEIERANSEFELWTRFVVPAGTYPGQEADIETVGQPNFLAVNANVDEEAVYLITKTIFENLPFLVNIHPATEEMSLEAALNGLPVPLHPGALRYYEEVGLEIPDRLRP